MNLFEDTLLVQLSIRQAGISARSRTLSREAADAHEADRDSVHGVILKLSKETLSPLQAIINPAREFHLANTLPWGKNGERLIPVTRYAHWKRELTIKQNAFNDEVEEMLSHYPTLRKDYMRRVNDLAQEIPFPTLQEMQGNFGFELQEQPLPNLNDLRLNHLDPKTVEDLKVRITNAMAERLEEAHRDIINRLFAVVARVHEQTGKEDGRLFETLRTNIEEAVDVLPKLNLKNDPEITRLITRVRTELASIDVVTLRNDPKERAKTSKLAGSILNDLKHYGKPVAPVKVTAKTVKSGSVKSAFANISI